MRSLIALLALLFLVLNPTAHAAQRNLAVTKNTGEQKRVALVIGNAAYHDAPLKNPVNDAKAMSDALNGLGFQVIEVTDATQKEMNRAITAFGEKLNGETAALFFYAGHGLQVKGKNYIVPVDAQIKTESAVASESVSVDTVLEQLNASPVSIVILDACRNNPFERSFRKMGGGGLAQMDAPKGSFIAYATAPGKTANDGDGKNGLFTQELLKHINEPGLDLEKVFKRVRASVAAKSGDAQMPWDSSSMTGEFYFKPGDATQVASLVPVPVQPARIKSKDEIEQDTWDSARDSNNVDAVNEYLKQYPKGRFVGQARVLITTLKKSPVKPAEPVEPVTPPSGREDGETLLWGEAQKGNSKEDYQAYLDQYPKGKYVALAKSRIKKLQDDAANENIRKEEASARQEAERQRQQTGEAKKGYVSQGGLTWMPVTFEKSWAEANSYCTNTAINGLTNWRLPMKHELEALYASGAMNGQGWKLVNIWSSTPNPFSRDFHTNVSLDDGYVASGNKMDRFNVTCVRAETKQRQEADRQRIQDEEAELIKREEVEAEVPEFISQGGLTWMPATLDKTWAEANSYCTSTTIKGQSGWRLPTKDELITLSNSGALNVQGWRKFTMVWSSTPLMSGRHYYVVWLSGHSDGKSESDLDTQYHKVTCVR